MWKKLRNINFAFYLYCFYRGKYFDKKLHTLARCLLGEAENKYYIDVDHALASCRASPSFPPSSDRRCGRKSSRRNTWIRMTTGDHARYRSQALSPDRSAQDSWVGHRQPWNDTTRFIALIYGANLGRLFPSDYPSFSLSPSLSPNKHIDSFSCYLLTNAACRLLQNTELSVSGVRDSVAI